MITVPPPVQATRPLWRLAGLATLLAFASAGCDSQEQTDPGPPVPPVLGITLDGYELRRTSYSDEDGLIQAGEGIVVDFFVTNTSSAAYDNIGTVARSTGPVLQLGAFPEGPGSSYQSIDRLGLGESVRVTVGFAVAPNTPAGTAIPLTLSLVARDGLSVAFNVSFTTSALPYSWAAESVTVTQDTDGDGRVEPGEEATVQFTPRRTGTPRESSRCPEYRVTSPLAQVSFPSGTPVGYCPDGVEQSFRFRASSTLTPGTVLPFVIRLSDGLSNTWDTPVSVPLE